MAYFLDRLGVHITHDSGQFVTEASSKVIAHAEALAKKAGRPFTYQDRVVHGKDDLARQIAVRDGITEGLICVFSTVEPAMCFGLAGGAIRPRLRKCLHLYIYVIDRELGFIHIRLQTFCRQRVQLGQRFARFSPVAHEDADLFQAVPSGSHLITGLSNRDPQQQLWNAPTTDPAQTRRRYRVTLRGRRLLAAALHYRRRDFQSALAA